MDNGESGKHKPADGHRAAIADDGMDLTWRSLRTLNLFRLFLAVSLLGLFHASGDPRFFGDSHPALFATAATAYLLFAGLCALLIRARWLPAPALVITQLTVDVVAVVLMMHASGGISSGLGGLLVVFVGASSLMLPLQVPGFLAALATLAILGEQVFSQLTGASSASNYPAAGILGAIIFAISLAARPLAKRLQASEALAHQRGIDLANLSELNQYIVQHLRESIVVLDDADRIRLINSSAAGLLGIEPGTEGVTLASAAPQLASFVNRWRNEARLPGHAELMLPNPERSLRLAVHLAPLGQGAGRAGPVLLFIEDASLMNARVQQSKLASLGRLSASIAHEIRNPVGAMSHAGQLLAESPALADSDRRLTEIIQSHADRVSHIIDNVLQLSRRESGTPEDLALGPWLEDFVAEFSSTLELHESEIVANVLEDGLVARIDASHLRQVLWNLCDNAVKYASETGGIMVELRAGREARSGQPYVEVLDRGRGIDPAIADKIFEPFYTERQGGTGLGLYISRELCELNHATLVYQPRDQGGSIFRIVFADGGRWQQLDEAQSQETA